MPNLGAILKSLFAPGEPTLVGVGETTRGRPTGVAQGNSGDDEYLVLKKDSAGQKGRTASDKPVELPALAAPGLVISPAFKLVVWLVFALIILSAAALMFLALQPVTSSLQTVMNLIGAAFSGAVGALLGLIGGKAIN